MSKADSSFLYNLVIWPLKLIIALIKLALLTGFIFVGWYVLQMVGVFSVQVPVTGASMLPTLPEAGFVSFQRYLPDSRAQRIIPQKLQRGDIVVFENEATHKELAEQDKEATGFVKRVIGIAGDIVEIKDGFVYMNGKRLDEPYTLKPRSTFGGTEIQDCQAIRVPAGTIFVLGDNRKISMDTRQIGLVATKDVEYYIPYSRQQTAFASKWRDTAHDFDTEDESLFDVDAYLALLNSERAKHNLEPLTYQSKLEQSAKLRAQVMLKYDEFDQDAPKSGYGMKQAMRDVGYANIVYGEFPMTGFYDTEELFAAFMEQPGAKEFLLNPDYDEVGVSTFIGELNNCPVQVVVQHLAGYIPPNYGSGEISTWKEGGDALKDIQSGWSQLKEYDEFYTGHQTDIDRINEIIELRIDRINQIVKRMEANEWLTDEEQMWMEEDQTLGEEQNAIADRLNKAQ